MNLWACQQLVKRFGPLWLAKRAWTYGCERLGILKFRLPSKPWSDIKPDFSSPAFDSLSGAALLDQKQHDDVRFLFDFLSTERDSEAFARFDLEKDWPQQVLNRVSGGNYRYFSARWIDHGSQPDWFLNPYSGEHAPSKGHFSRLSEFDYGDVKTVWELSRFSFVYDLVRAYSRTNDADCGEQYWRHVEHWMESNPPYEGINWNCGQESSFRLLAILFGFWAFGKLDCSTAARVNKLYQLICSTAIRVERHINYAINQQNNHGISEAVLLWTVGVLFPELKSSTKWKAIGERVLVRLCSELIYDDGGFSQSSANYHRLVVELLSWTIRLAQLNDISLNPTVVDRAKRLTDCLASMVEPANGRVPRFGNDDGAHLLPLSHCDYEDYRPTIQVAELILNGQPRFEAGKWDESALWFGLGANDHQASAADDRTNSDPPRIQSRAMAGCHSLVLDGNKIFVRAGTFRHRPAQMDATHVDIWWNGFDVATDPGIYSYNAAGHWQQLPFYHASSHNTVIVDGKEVTKRLSRFMFLPWQESEIGETAASENLVAAEFIRTVDFGLDVPVSHRRTVALISGDIYLILDSLESKSAHDYRLNWLLNCNQVRDGDGLLELDLKSGDRFFAALQTNVKNRKLDIIPAAEGSATGWIAPRYLELEPAVSAQMTSRESANCKFLSVFAPDKQKVSRWSDLAEEIFDRPEFSDRFQMLQKAIQ